MVTLAFLCELGVRGMLKHRAKKGLIDEDQHFFCDVSGWQIANPVLVYWCIWCILDAFWWQCLWIVCPEDTTTELRLEAVLPFVSEISRDTSEYPTLKKTQISPEHESGPKRHWSIVQGLMLLVLGKVNLAFLSLACLTRCPRCLQTLMQIYVHGSHVVVFSNMCCSNAFSLKTLPDISIQFWEKYLIILFSLKKKTWGDLLFDRLFRWKDGLKKVSSAYRCCQVALELMRDRVGAQQLVEWRGHRWPKVENTGKTPRKKWYFKERCWVT